MSVHFETWASDESTEGFGDGLRRRGVGEVEPLVDGRRDLDLCNKKTKQNTQCKRWCQTIKRLHNKHEGSQQKRQTRAYMIPR